MILEFLTRRVSFGRGTVFLALKLRQVWALAFQASPKTQWLKETVWQLVNNETAIELILRGTFVLIESCARGWARFRRVVVGASVFLLNSLIIVGLAGLFFLRRIAGPMLSGVHASPLVND